MTLSNFTDGEAATAFASLSWSLFIAVCLCGLSGGSTVFDKDQTTSCCHVVMTRCVSLANKAFQFSFRNLIARRNEAVLPLIHNRLLGELAAAGFEGAL